MMQTVRKKCGCGAVLPLSTKVGDICPQCGAKLIFERQTVIGTSTAVGPGHASGRNYAMAGLVAVLAGIVLFFAIPPVVASFFDGVGSASLYFSSYLGMAAFIISFILCLRSFLSLKSGMFDRGSFKSVIFLFTGVFWFLIMCFFAVILIDMTAHPDSGSPERGITEIGWVSFVICGPLSAVLAAIVSLPIVLLSRKRAS